MKHTDCKTQSMTPIEFVQVACSRLKDTLERTGGSPCIALIALIRGQAVRLFPNLVAATVGRPAEEHLNDAYFQYLASVSRCDIDPHRLDFVETLKPLAPLQCRFHGVIVAVTHKENAFVVFGAR